MNVLWSTLLVVHQNYVFALGLLAAAIGVWIPLAIAVRVRVVRLLGLVLGVVLCGTIYLGVTGFEDVYRYVHAHGAVGELVASSIRGTGNRINDQEITEYVAFLKTREGTILEVTMDTSAVPQYPVATTGTFLMLDRKYAVRYLPAYPRWFVVDQGSHEDVARRDACRAIQQELQQLRSRLVLSPSDASLVARRQELAAQEQALACGATW